MNPADLPPTHPREDYERRLRSAREDLQALDAREARLANARLLTFTAGALVAWLSLMQDLLAPGWLLVPTAAFAGLVVVFNRVADARQRSTKRVAYYERGLDRLDDRWAGTGEPGTRFRDPEHPYAEDLDLFGPGSLFERISAARTLAGQETLADWLKQPATPDVVKARQEAVGELRPQVDLREDVALLGGEVGSVASFEGLARWGAAPTRLQSWPVRVAAALLSAIALPTLFGWLLLGWGAWPFLIVSALELAIYLPHHKRIQGVLETVERRAEELAVLAGLLARLERARFESTILRRVRSALETSGRPASRQIDHLRQLVATLDARRNMLLGPFSPWLLWGTQVAFAIESWRSTTGPSIGGWLVAAGEFESLASLASFAYESPDDPFPELLDPDSDGQSPHYEAEGLAHPLLPAGQAVRNDLHLGGSLRLLIVSGSNMSGKSTLLRAVGASIVLAMAGGTVRSRRLRLTPLAVGASLRVQDSLLQGRSRFFAEILRLRKVLDLARGPSPLLFLLDEILAGTNSHDRRLGAEAIVLGLVERGAIGLVTTHDLALAEIADRLGPRAANVHFADHLQDGVMSFDYTMRPGVVRHSNALALMRSVGLEV